jgi:hypothetical protein
MMKFPSSFAEGMAPSGNSFALTYPGVFGSRVGSGGRAPLLAFAGVWAIAGPKPASRQINNALVGTTNMQNSFPPILTYTTIAAGQGTGISLGSRRILPLSVSDVTAVLQSDPDRWMVGLFSPGTTRREISCFRVGDRSTTEPKGKHCRA